MKKTKGPKIVYMPINTNVPAEKLLKKLRWRHDIFLTTQPREDVQSVADSLGYRVEIEPMIFKEDGVDKLAWKCTVREFPPGDKRHER